MPPDPAAELESLIEPPNHAPTMGKLAKIRYTHDAMIDLIIQHPELSQNQLAAAFGYTPAWISNILAADAFQARLAERRKEVIDPTLVASMAERVRGLTLQSMEVLKRKLDAPIVSDTVALRAFELGAKALGLGGNAPPAAPPVDLDRLAARLLALNPQGPQVVEGEVLSREVTP